MRAPLSSPYFLVKLLADNGDGSFTHEEWWLDSTNTYAQKVGGRYGDTLNPGWPVDGFTPAVGDLVLCRSADGAGGLAWEVSDAIGGSGGGGGFTITTHYNATDTTALVPTPDATWTSSLGTHKIDIPSAGEYLLVGTVGGTGKLSGMGSNSGILCVRLNDGSGGIPGSEMVLLSINSTAQAVNGSATFCCLYAATGAVTITLDTYRDAFGGSWAIGYPTVGSFSGTVPNTETRLGYVKLT